MNLLGILDLSGSALKAERLRAEVAAANLANTNTTRTEQGGPYVPQHVIFSAAKSGSGGGSFANTLAGAQASEVRVVGPVSDLRPPDRRYEPGHQDADETGYVSYPNIRPAEEIIDLMGAARAYQLNTAAVQATKNMIQHSFEILR